MVYQASISDGQLFLFKSAFNPRKANDFLDDALKALNAFWFSWRLASLHWFVLLAVVFLFSFFSASCLKQVLKVSLLLLRNQRWLKQRGRALENLKNLLSWARKWGEQCSLQTLVQWWGRSQLFCWVGNSVSHGWNLPGLKEWWGPWQAGGHPCSQGQGTFSAHKVAARVLNRGNCLEIPTKLRGHPHPYLRFYF